MKKLMSFLVVLVLVVGLGVGAYFLFFNKKQEATSVMTLDVNPEVQFILDQNNKVMDVTAVNEDGSKLITQVKFEGLKAEDAAKLFVEISNQMGKVSLDASVDNRSVTIYISCDDEAKTSEAIKNLQENVVNSVNKYFKDNGIINGAKVVVEDMSKALEKFGSQIRSFTGTTFEEAMNYVKEVNHEFENISYEARSGLQTIINGLKDAYEKANDALISAVESWKKTVKSLKEQISAQEEKIKALPDKMKAEAQKNLNTLKEKLNEAEKTLNEKQAQLQAKLDELQKKIDAEIKKIQKECEEALKTLKETINAQIEEGKKIIEAHKKAFEEKTEEQKQIIIDAIEAFQNSLVMPIA